VPTEIRGIGDSRDSEFGLVKELWLLRGRRRWHFYGLQSQIDMLGFVRSDKNRGNFRVAVSGHLGSQNIDSAAQRGKAVVTLQIRVHRLRRSCVLHLQLNSCASDRIVLRVANRAPQRSDILTLQRQRKQQEQEQRSDRGKTAAKKASGRELPRNGTETGHTEEGHTERRESDSNEIHLRA
jgi:hypothetical protein